MSSSSNSDLKGAIFGMGNPLLDICAEADNALLEKYNLKENDAILATEEHMPLYQELIANKDVYYIAGGATQNALRGAQRLLPSGSTVFVGCVSKDDYADKLLAAAQADGLKTLYMINEEVPTGTCATLLSGKNRSLVANLSAANKYQISHLNNPEIWKQVEQAKLYYISGFFITVSPDSILKVCKQSIQASKVMMMNLSAPFVPQFYTDTLKELLGYCDVLFGNETEAKALSKAFGYELEDVEEIAMKISNHPKIRTELPRVVIITQGADPTIVATENKITKFNVMEIKDEDIVDTNGAGDAFVGGFISQYVQAKPLHDCIKVGHFLSKIVLQQAGPFYPKTIPEIN